MDKKTTHTKKEVCISFKEYFYSKSKKLNIWRCKDNIPIKDADINVTYENGCDTLSLYLNDSISPNHILRPGESYITKMDKLISIDILCETNSQEYYSTKRGPCKCKIEHPVEKPCCCSGNIVITKYTPKPPKPKLDYSFILVLFVLLVIIGCTSCNRHYYPMC